MWFLIGLSFFSVGSFFVCMSESIGFMAGWFVLEIISLGVSPYFFFEIFPYSQRALLHYVIISGLSSFFMLCGALVENYSWVLIGMGVIMKLGVFPFMSWLYEVVVYSNSIVIWMFSGFLKLPFVFILYYLGFDSYPYQIFCVSCFILLGLNLWNGVGGWRRCWGHMLISGSASLVIISMSCSSSVSGWVYLIYFVWSTLALMFFSFLPKFRSVSEEWVLLWFVIIFLSFPFSLAVFYKFAIGSSLLFCNGYIFSSWCFYTISEQLYLLFYIVSRGKTRPSIDLFSSV